MTYQEFIDKAKDNARYLLERGASPKREKVCQEMLGFTGMESSQMNGYQCLRCGTYKPIQGGTNVFVGFCPNCKIFNKSQ